MSNVKVQYLFSFLVLFSLFQTVRTDFDYVKEETLKNSFEETVSQEVNKTTPKSLVNDEKSDNYELKKQDMSNFTFSQTQRKPRNLANGTIGYALQCLSCFANASSRWNCYTGVSLPRKKCNDAEQCYTELNPEYIKRGCILPGRVNRTFTCKCPLCNDKPSFEINHYEYKQLSDWEYDNARLETPLEGLELMCKVCETKGTNPMSDKNCRHGKNADYMVCARKQVCYTNIDDETDFVSRGCADIPLFNSIYFFCNNADCNSGEFPDPKQKIRLRKEAIQLKDDRDDMKGRKALKSFGSKTCITAFCSMFMILISTLIQCI